MTGGGAPEVPEWAYEQVALSPHNPDWARSARREAAELARLLEPWLAEGHAEVEHVGSTAVPGLVAKPVLDLMAAVDDPGGAVSGAGGALAAAGWVYVPVELDARPWRRFFVKPDPTGRHRRAHLHLLRPGHHRWHDQLVFREALRADPDVARDYERLKRRLAAAGGHDRESYTEAKAAFVREVLARVRR